MDSSGSVEPRSANPNAPQISFTLYLYERNEFVGHLLETVLFGIAIALFVRCMIAFLNPANRTNGGIKWGLVAYTIAILSTMVVGVSMALDLQSIAYVDNREFRDNVGYPGPYGYWFFVDANAIVIVPAIMSTFTQLLADGLLLYRCYVIYGANRWVIAFPFVMYLATGATGFMRLYGTVKEQTVSGPFLIDSNDAYNAIYIALNILLTLMIIVRLIIHDRNMRNAMGSPASFSDLYKHIILMLVESLSLNTITTLLYLVPWYIKSPVGNTFAHISGGVQVIAVFLLTLRVANHEASPKDRTASRSMSMIRFRSQGEATDARGTTSDENSTGSTDVS